MAAPAAEPRRGLISDLRGLLRPEPAQLELALRLALICALTTLVVEIYQTPSPALTAYLVFFLNRPDRVTSLIMNLALVLVITIVIGLVFGAALLVLDNPMWRVIAIALISFFLLFLASASKLRPIGATVALITAYALDVLGGVQVGEEVTRALLYAWLFIAIPAAVSAVVNLLIAPSPRRLAERAIARRLAVAARVLRAPEGRAPQALSEASEGSGELLKWLHLAGLEKTAPPELLALLHQAAGATLSLFAALNVMLAHPEAALPAGLRERLARLVDELGSEWARGQQPPALRWQDAPDDTALSPPARALLGELKAALVDFSQPRPSDAPELHAASAEPGGFFAADAFTNPDHIRYALRTTGAALFCYLLYSVLSWPGIHTCFLTCYIVSLDTVAESVEKLSLRIVGCLIGAAAGIAAIVFLVPALTSIGDLLIVVFLGTLITGYVAAGSPRVAYAGFQAAFAFYLCVLQGNGPGFNMVTIRDRVLGVLLGNLVAYVALSSFWPVSVGRRVDPAIGRILARLGALSDAIGVGRRRDLAAELQDEIAAVETDLEVVHYEPAALRPSPAWLDVRREALEAISALKAPLLLSAGADDDTRARHAGRLRGLATRLTTPAPAAPPEVAGATGPGKEPLDAMVDSELERVDRALGRMFGLPERTASLGQA
ncbi:MAG: FUSC family protein [Pseudomonadota bacterium]